MPSLVRRRFAKPVLLRRSWVRIPPSALSYGQLTNNFYFVLYCPHKPGGCISSHFSPQHERRRGKEDQEEYAQRQQVGIEDISDSGSLEHHRSQGMGGIGEGKNVGEGPDEFRNGLQGPPDAAKDYLRRDDEGYELHHLKLASGKVGEEGAQDQSARAQQEHDRQREGDFRSGARRRKGSQ